MQLCAHVRPDHDLGDGRAEAARYVVLLNGEDMLKLIRAGEYCLPVDRLYRREAVLSHGYPLLFKHVAGVRDLVQNRAGREYRDALSAALSLADGISLADGELRHRGVHKPFAAPAKPQVERAVGLGNSLDRVLRLNSVSGADDRNVRQRPQTSDILGRVVAYAQRAVNIAAAHADDLDVRVVVGAVVAYLLKAAQGREVAYRIGKSDLSLKRHARRDSRKILLGYTRVDELIGQRLPKGLEHSEAQIAGYQIDPIVLTREFYKLANGRISHFASISRI